MVEVVNIVASGHVGRELDLGALYTDLNIPNKIYEPESSPGLQLRFEPDGPVIIIYSTGTYTIMGATTEEEVDETYDAFIYALSKLEIKVREIDQRPEISNLICKDYLERELNLPALTIALDMERVEYEPEQSPFVYYWPEKFDCLITIPANGEVIITGVTTTEQAERAFEHLQDQIESLI